MSAVLRRLRSPTAIQAALDEFARLGRTAFLTRYGFGKSRDYLVRNPRTGELADAKAIVAAAFGFEHPNQGPLKVEDFGGDATVVPVLQSLGFEAVKIGEDWSDEEVSETVAAYFDMLRLDAEQQPYTKSARNAALREKLKGRSKAAVEMKHQNVSAVLNGLGLPFIPGYKPRGNTQLLLRKKVQEFIQTNAPLVARIVDAMEEFKTPAQQTFKAVLVEPPKVEMVVKAAGPQMRARLPRKIDYAARDESNRKLGRAGEQWVLGHEQHRLHQVGLGELFPRVDWVADRLGDGLGYDILSFDEADKERFIEVKTTNGAYASSFIVSRNELDFSEEVGEAFCLYRVFQFREAPMLYVMRGELARHVHLEAVDFRASLLQVRIRHGDTTLRVRWSHCLPENSLHAKCGHYNRTQRHPVGVKELQRSDKPGKCHEHCRALQDTH